MEKSPKIEITELFMAKAGKKGWDRCFHGTIKRETNSDGNTIVYGRLRFMMAVASAKIWELGDLLDDMVLIVLDKKGCIQVKE
ncbi:MAG: hypothetical protein H6540_04545 [Bacteroidales bacterium]|nr:hypothetical protein [Bacteroidales bacterium]